MSLFVNKKIFGTTFNNKIVHLALFFYEPIFFKTQYDLLSSMELRIVK